jgi:hypothetical protein
MTLSVLQRQAQYVGFNFRRLIAFQDGSRIWRRQYGRQLASELARSFSQLSGKDKRRKLLLLASHYPQGLLMMVGLRMMPMFGVHRTVASFGQAAIDAEARNRVQSHRRQQTMSNLVAVHRSPLVSGSRNKETVSLQ